jgi:hypothetical protein
MCTSTHLPSKCGTTFSGSGTVFMISLMRLACSTLGSQSTKGFSALYRMPAHRLGTLTVAVQAGMLVHLETSPPYARRLNLDPWKATEARPICQVKILQDQKLSLPVAVLDDACSAVPETCPLPWHMTFTACLVLSSAFEISPLSRR